MNKIICFLIVLFLMLSSINIIAQIPRVINYQGMLMGNNSQPVSNGNYDLTFKLYDETDTEIWSEVHNQVAVNNGLFQVILGTITPFGIPFDKPYTLGIQVGSDPELQPRTQLTSVAYSIRAEDADKLMGIYASPTPEPNKLLPLDASGKFPSSVITNSGEAGTYIQKNVPDTSRGTSTAPMLLVSNLGDGDGIDARSTNGTGLAGRSTNSDGVSGWTGVNGKSGVFGYSTEGKGIVGRSDKDDGITGWTGAANKSGVFGHTATTGGFGITGTAEVTGAVGVYAYNSATGNYAKLATDTLGLEVHGRTHFALSTGEVNISTPGGNPGLITFAQNGHRRDIVFQNDRMRLLTSSSNSAPSKGIDIFEDGNVSVTGQLTCASLKLTGGSDIAEPFNVGKGDNIIPGMVMAIDSKAPGKLKLADKCYDRCVAGVISGAGNIVPGMIMGQKGSVADGEYPVALTGRVFCWADASYGSIEIGDLLTTSEAPGYAMKVADLAKAQGAILGKAMTSLKEGQGLILILVTLQ
jgi:hypothetical protein